MARQTTLYVRWCGSGALELRLSQGSLAVRAANAEIVFEPRNVVIEAKYAYKKEIEDRNRKNLYVGFAEKLEPLEAPRVDIMGRNYVGNFEVVYTDLEFEKYLTVVTPADYLYDYVVITTRELMLQMPPRRKIYYEEQPFDKLVVYMV